MNEEFMKQVMAELIESTGAALGILAAAMARQLDPERRTADLKAQLKAAELTKAVPPLAIRLATHALASAEAETALRNPPKH